MSTLWPPVLKGIFIMTQIDKKELLHSCHQIVDKKIELANHTMELAEESAHQESKSSVGDKYETGRAMAQQEKDKASIQLAELQKLKRILSTINPEDVKSVVEPGALVRTNMGVFFVATSVGEVSVGDGKVFVISPISPLIQAMLGKSKEDKVVLNGREFEILDIQ